MPRIRSIKPEFWTSGQVLECSRNARLLFVGMWNFADDEGRIPNLPKSLKAQIYPADDLSFADVAGMVAELSTNGLVVPYEVDGLHYLQISGWKHQRIDKRQPAKYPAPPKRSSTIPRTLPPDRIGEDRIGEEGKGEDKKDAAPNGARLNLGDEPQGSQPRSAKEKTPAPPLADPEADLFRRGKQVLGQGAGGLIKQLLKVKGKPELARAAIEMAAVKQNPREYIGAIIRGAAAEQPYSPIS